jgi:hypothetical protein
MRKISLKRFPGTVCVLAATLIFLMSVPPVLAASEPLAQPSPVDNALQLLVIELFFLLIGLLVLAVLGYFIWDSWRKKKEKGKSGK